MNDFGQLLRNARRGAPNSPSMGSLARKLGMAPSHLSDVERGKRPPLSAARIFVAAKWLHADPAPLLKAAAENRGAFELDASVGGEPGKRAGAALMRAWPGMSAAGLAELEEIAKKYTTGAHHGLEES